jgi:hypothetical protein
MTAQRLNDAMLPMIGTTGLLWVSSRAIVKGLTCHRTGTPASAPMAAKQRSNLKPEGRLARANWAETSLGLADYTPRT